MMNKNFNLFLILVKDIFSFVAQKLHPVHLGSSEKVVYLNFYNPNIYHRYFYNFVKTLKISGYTVLFPMDFKKYRNLRNGDVYLGLMLREKGLVSIKNIKKNAAFIEISDKDLSCDYYKTYFENNNLEGKEYHVPMSCHPYLFSKNIWDEELEQVEKINSLFVFGNFDRNAYKTIKKSGFNIIDRVSLIDFFSGFENFISVKNKTELLEIIKNKVGRKFIFSEKQNCEIPLDELRKTVNNFRYFLCCPGVFGPLSHNLVETMSAGVIPVIQKCYAEVIYPNLEHRKNALIFENLDDLKQIMDSEIFNFSDQEYITMHENVRSYYETFLNPKNVGKTIIENIKKGNLIFLNASERSVNFRLK